jgi:hypothetical protein
MNRTNLPSTFTQFPDVKSLYDRRRRARQQRRWAIALCIIGSVLLLAWEMFRAY